ncbi:uncharacterized protein B0I36DRAFT_363610 [Microdochium trichocladiopsis]|uniref:Uncharacterized protein n=1 Tax=Microdochium trichocladiopsis TaxID=1682393 RepID=A0A9P9BP91_9PEZI|nr:uncharacterized protein B0I36DRAFT_363610 [Microdochium trichocladiopsis]KAH7029007.1 hypothetical protein B0I36DRAFT_363610 [Microdochium trichocladiopsis]
MPGPQLHWASQSQLASDWQTSIFKQQHHKQKPACSGHPQLDQVIANFPNLRRLFIEARSEEEEREVSRKAFYNAVLFMSSVAIFSLIAQRLNARQ